MRRAIFAIVICIFATNPAVALDKGNATTLSAMKFMHLFVYGATRCNIKPDEAATQAALMNVMITLGTPGDRAQEVALDLIRASSDPEYGKRSYAEAEADYHQLGYTCDEFRTEFGLN